MDNRGIHSCRSICMTLRKEALRHCQKLLSGGNGVLRQLYYCYMCYHALNTSFTNSHWKYLFLPQIIKLFFTMFGKNILMLVTYALKVDNSKLKFQVPVEILWYDLVYW